MKKELIQKGENFLFSVEEYRFGPFYVTERKFTDTGNVTAEITGPTTNIMLFDDKFSISFRGDIYEDGLDKSIEELKQIKELIKQFRELKEAEK